MWFDTCIFGLINEGSCSPGGKSHTGRSGGLCWRLEPWRKAPSCVSWRSTQVGSCWSPHLNLSSLNSPAVFLTLPKVTRNCVGLVLMLWIIWHDSFFSTFTGFWKQNFFFPINTFLWESQVFNAQVGSPGAQGGKTGSLWAPGQGVNHWWCNMWPSGLKNPETPHRLFQNWRRGGNSWVTESLDSHGAFDVWNWTLILGIQYFHGPVPSF